MSFPVVFPVFGLTLPAHAVFEILAYMVGFRLYLWLRRNQADAFSDGQRLVVLAGAVFGAGLGSKLLGFAEHPELWPVAAHQPAAVLGAKTILGALLGGIIGVEVAKAMAGIRGSTGDIYVLPLLTAIAIGRVGCLLTGVSDGTWGDATRLPFGFDAGDGVIRHPTPLYEILFLMLLGLAFLALRRVRLQTGDRFKLFIMAYCAWRFVVEFLKPVTTYSLGQHLNIVQNIATTTSLRAAPGLSLLQAAALAGFAAYAAVFARRSWKGLSWRRATISSSN